jgi:hypothetical protein
MEKNDSKDELANLLKANDIFYSQLDYADLKLSFVFGANIAVLAGSVGGTIQLFLSFNGDPKTSIPDWAFFTIIGVLIYVIVIDLVSTIFTIAGLIPNTRKKGLKSNDSDSTFNNNQFFYGDVAKYSVDAIDSTEKGSLKSKKDYLNELFSSGTDGAIEDIADQNIAVSKIVVEKYAKTSWSIYFLVSAIFPLWLIIGIFYGKNKKPHL